MPLLDVRQIGAGIIFAVTLLLSVSAHAGPFPSNYRMDPTGGYLTQHRLWLARNYASMAGPDDVSNLTAGIIGLREQTRFIRLAPGDHKWAAKPLPYKSQSNKERFCLARGVYFEARGESLEAHARSAEIRVAAVREGSEQEVESP